MARDNRIEFENSFHHVIIRGYNQINIFLEDEDFIFFLKQLELVHISHGIIIHSYCFMNNHLHLLLQNPLVNLSRVMQLVLSRFANYFKKKYKHRGKVLEKRYTSYLVDTEMYLMQLSKYIHCNPVGVIVNSPSDWHWSSYNYYTNPKLLKPSFLETDLIYQKFRARDPIQELIKYTLESDDWNPMDCIFSNTILGSDKFIEEVTLKHIAPEINTDICASYKLNKTYRFRIDEIKKYIIELTDDLEHQKSLLILALREKTNLSYKDISKDFFSGLTKVTTLSERYKSIKLKSINNKNIAKAIYKIRNL
jgi:putative transposase